MCELREWLRHEMGRDWMAGRVVKQGSQLVKISFELTLSWRRFGAPLLTTRGSTTHVIGIFYALISICWRPWRNMVPNP